MKIPAILILMLVFVSCTKKETAISEASGTPASGTRQPGVESAQPTKAEALLAMQCYNNAFYHQYGTYGPSFKAYYYSDVTHTGRTDFW